MVAYNKNVVDKKSISGKEVISFVDAKESENIDWETVESFGNEWEKFSHFNKQEIEDIGNEYFDIVDETMLNKNTVALDMGCGTGRWTKYVASKAKFVEAIDPSKAVVSAVKLLEDRDNVRITQADVSNIPFPDESFDFVFSLGVLHHIPDTKDAMKKTVAKVKPGGHFLVYLYYDLDNKASYFRLIYGISNFIRRGICILPNGLKRFICDILAILFYAPMVLLSKAVNAIFGAKWLAYIPLSWYHNKSWKVIRNDALDRFGTPLEQRFKKEEIKQMMMDCGLTDIKFSNEPPYWHAVGRKK